VLLTSLCWLQPSLAVAEEDGVKLNLTEPEPWKENTGALPNYPDGKQYVAAPIQLAGSNLEMFIDAPSLAVGDDGVVRYVLSLRSASGSENVFYEGMRCATQEWRSYAYGASSGSWQALESPWKFIRGAGVERYRMQLFQLYLCNAKVGPFTRDEMLQRMRYGVPRTIE
jgi:hypothetical protein